MTLTDAKPVRTGDKARHANALIATERVYAALIDIAANVSFLHTFVHIVAQKPVSTKAILALALIGAWLIETSSPFIALMSLQFAFIDIFY
jgi:hypothetical protein